MSSRPQVTITLGHTGQVVKRAEPDSTCTPYTERKRSIRERLGSNTDSFYSCCSHDDNKRQRTDTSSWSLGADNYSNDKQYAPSRWVGRHDLRFKLMNKSLSQRNRTVAQGHHEVGRREKISRNSSQSPVRSVHREHALQSRGSGLVRQMPPTRSADDLLELDSLRRPRSSRTMDGFRHGSPDRLLGASRGNYNEVRCVPSMRSSDASRPRILMTTGVADPSRSTTFIGKYGVPVEAAKSVLGASPGSIMQKGSYMSEQPLTVASLLSSLGLRKYAILFQAEEVDMTALKQMGDNDLKDMGIPMGPRKKILLAMLLRSKHRQRSGK